jgi:hypothetical protein
MENFGVTSCEPSTHVHPSTLVSVLGSQRHSGQDLESPKIPDPASGRSGMTVTTRRFGMTTAMYSEDYM